ncbi:MAG TPA: hypothetical protein VMS04_02550, partial [Vicinamibacterales bacterium]|nr:hypothetical protein [Vicinamibacterales bacterium]
MLNDQHLGGLGGEAEYLVAVLAEVSYLHPIEAFPRPLEDEGRREPPACEMDMAREVVRLFATPVLRRRVPEQLTQATLERGLGNALHRAPIDLRIDILGLLKLVDVFHE